MKYPKSDVEKSEAIRMETEYRYQGLTRYGRPLKNVGWKREEYLCVEPWSTRRRVKAQTTRMMETDSPTISRTRRDMTNPRPPPTEVGIVPYTIFVSKITSHAPTDENEALDNTNT